VVGSINSSTDFSEVASNNSPPYSGSATLWSTESKSVSGHAQSRITPEWTAAICSTYPIKICMTTCPASGTHCQLATSGEQRPPPPPITTVSDGLNLSHEPLLQNLLGSQNPATRLRLPPIVPCHTRTQSCRCPCNILLRVNTETICRSSGSQSGRPAPDSKRGQVPHPSAPECTCPSARPCSAMLSGLLLTELAVAGASR